MLRHRPSPAGPMHATVVSEPQHSMLKLQCFPFAAQHDGSLGAPACLLSAQILLLWAWPQHWRPLVHGSPILRQAAATSSFIGTAARVAPAAALASPLRIPRRVGVVDRERTRQSNRLFSITGLLLILSEDLERPTPGRSPPPGSWRPRPSRSWRFSA